MRIKPGDRSVKGCRLFVLLVFLLPGSGWSAQATEFGMPVEAQLVRIAELNDHGHIEQARQMLEQARAATSQAEPEHQIELQLLLAHNLGLRGEFDDALDKLDRLLEQPLTGLQHLKALTRAANLAGVARQHERAFTYLRDALSLEADIGSPVHQSALLSNAAQMVASAGEFEKALQYGQRAVQLADASGTLREQCVARQRLAAAHGNDHDPQRYLAMLEDAMNHCRAASELLFSGSLALQKAHLKHRMNQIDQAEHSLEQASRFFSLADYRPGMPLVHLLQARLMFEKGQPEQAHALVSAQIDSLRARRMWDYLVDAHDLLAAIAREQDRLDQALVHMDRRIDARERQLERDRFTRLAYLEIELKLEEREQQIALLRAQLDADKLQASTERYDHRFRELSFVGSTLLVLLLMLLLFRTSRERGHYQLLSRHDSLTGLLNHTCFFEFAAEALDKAQENHFPMCLILADIDHFKRVNDTHGHLAGDRVLKKVAARMREVFEDRGTVGRIGGEEFAIILPRCDSDLAGKAVQQLRLALNAGRTDDDDINVTISFGISQSRPEDNLTHLRQRADHALYKAKHSGRNTMIIAANKAAQSL